VSASRAPRYRFEATPRLSAGTRDRCRHPVRSSPANRFVNRNTASGATSRRPRIAKLAASRLWCGATRIASSPSPAQQIAISCVHRRGINLATGLTSKAALIRSEHLPQITKPTSVNAKKACPRQFFNGSTAPTANFYWVNGAFAGENRTVTLAVTVFGVARTVTATFRVFRPTADITATVGPVEIVYSCDERVMMTLGCSEARPGIQPGPGMVLHKNVVFPGGFSGEVTWLSLLTSTYRTKTYRVLQNGFPAQRYVGYGLDGRYP